MKKLHSRSNSTTWQQTTLVQFNKIVSTLCFHLQPHIQTIPKTIQGHMTWHQFTNYYCDTNQVSVMQECSKAALRPSIVLKQWVLIVVCCTYNIYITVIMFILILLQVHCLASRHFLYFHTNQCGSVMVKYKNIYLQSKTVFFYRHWVLKICCTVQKYLVA